MWAIIFRMENTSMVVMEISLATKIERRMSSIKDDSINQRTGTKTEWEQDKLVNPLLLFFRPVWKWVKKQESVWCDGASKPPCMRAIKAATASSGASHSYQNFLSDPQTSVSVVFLLLWQPNTNHGSTSCYCFSHNCKLRFSGCPAGLIMFCQIQPEGLDGVRGQILTKAHDKPSPSHRGDGSSNNTSTTTTNNRTFRCTPPPIH